MTTPITGGYPVRAAEIQGKSSAVAREFSSYALTVAAADEEFHFYKVTR
jgi:hypothetical protein